MVKYKNYKKAKNPYLCLIPNEWEEIPVRAVCSIKSLQNNIAEELLSVFLNLGVIPYSATSKKQVHKPSEDMSKYQLVEPGDLVLNNQQAWRGSLGVSKYRGIVSPAYVVMSVKNHLNSGYVNYMVRERAFVSQLVVASKGVGSIQRILHLGKLKNSYFIIPSREEQDQIVRYLDWQTSKINRLITAKKQQIQVLREQQQKLICEVITKGLHSDVDYKDSHITWIGDIPSHWSAIRCKYLFRERDERSKEGTETHLSMSQKYGLVPDSQLDERRMLSESYAGGKLCYQNDLVLNRLKAHLGVFALAPQFGVISPDYTVLIPNTERIIPFFGEMVLKSALCRRELRVRVRGIIEGFWRLYTDDFYTIYLPVPPIEEQKEIMQYIDAQAKKTAALENALNREIELLHELRTRLISDVVTGQVDVRSIEVPDFELVEEAADEAEEPADEMEVE